MTIQFDYNSITFQKMLKLKDCFPHTLFRYKYISYLLQIYFFIKNLVFIINDFRLLKFLFIYYEKKILHVIFR